MAYETILSATENGVRTITLNRPDAMNCLTAQMGAELQKELRDIAKAKAVRCVVVTGAGGKAFCAGQDLKEATSGPKPIDFTEHLRTSYNPFIAAIRALPVPVIAAINGVAAGAGWSLALACDLRIAVKTAKFVPAFGKIGLVPDCGMTWTLPRLVGQAKAFEIACFGDAIGADQALEWGLVNRVVEADHLAPATREWAETLARGPTKGFALTKQAFQAALTSDLPAQLEYEAMLQGIGGRTRDYGEGVKAFLEKRQPEFSGE